MEPPSLGSTTSASSPPVEPLRGTTITTDQNGMQELCVVYELWSI